MTSSALRTGIAGAFIQKFRNYQPSPCNRWRYFRATWPSSKALHDFVYESNRGSDVLFVPDLDALAARL